MELVHIEAVRMDNGELICMGKTLGFVGEGKNQISEKYVHDCPQSKK